MTRLKMTIILEEEYNRIKSYTIFLNTISKDDFNFDKDMPKLVHELENQPYEDRINMLQYVIISTNNMIKHQKKFITNPEYERVDKSFIMEIWEKLYKSNIPMDDDSKKYLLSLLQHENIIPKESEPDKNLAGDLIKKLYDAYVINNRKDNRKQIRKIIDDINNSNIGQKWMSKTNRKKYDYLMSPTFIEKHMKGKWGWKV